MPNQPRNSNLADFLPPKALGIKLITWQNYRKTKLKMSQTELSEFFGLRGVLLASLERGDLEYFSTEIEFADLINQLCIHCQERKEELFPELNDYWEYFPEFNPNFEDVVDYNEAEIDEEFDKTQLYELIRQVLKRLTPREELVLRKKFGIGYNELTSLELGQELFMTFTRIQQIEVKALLKIKSSKNSNQLKEFSELSGDEVSELKNFILNPSNK